MYKGMKFYHDKMFWLLVAMAVLFVIIVLIDYFGLVDYTDLRRLWGD